MFPNRAMAVTLAFVTLVPTMGWAQDDTAVQPDPQRGKVVFRTVGGCMNCHGWAADGKTGVNVRAPTGPSLRDTALNPEELAEVIQCGRPGTAMPYHDRAAYRDDRCYGLTKADFTPETEPMRGKTMKPEDIANIVAYLQADVIGRGEPTFEECIDFFDNRSASACKGMK